MPLTPQLPQPSGNATLTAMRVFLMILIFAVGFSGYVAAAHAFAVDSCAAAVEQGHNAAHDQNCAGHQQNQQDNHGQKSGQNHSHTKPDKNGCLDGHHCCTVTMAGLPVVVMPVPPLAKTQHMLPSFRYSDHLAVSLLRPPRALL